MHVELQVWVRKRKPATAVEAGQLADDYVQVRHTAVDPTRTLEGISMRDPAAPPKRDALPVGKRVT